MKRTIALLAMVAACTELPDESTITAAAKDYDIDCTNTDCGLNTSIVNGSYFSKLSFLGEQNEAGMVLSGYTGMVSGPDGIPNSADDEVRLDVWKDRLVSINANGDMVRANIALQGKGFHLTFADGKTYVVTIAEVNLAEDDYWAKDDDTRIETYKFVYVPLGSPSWTIPEPLCPATRYSGNTVASDAVVFEGELFDAETKDIDLSPPPGWFNVACRGSAPFKNFFMRYTFASQDAPLVQTWGFQRKALLDAWTANYCGDGRSFTYPGHPLRLRDKLDWIPHDSGWSWSKEIDNLPLTIEQLDSYEAIWNGDGAVCLNEPRKFGNDKVANDDLRKAIVDHCAAQVPSRTLPRCSELETVYPKDWKLRGHILTANPVD